MNLIKILLISFLVLFTVSLPAYIDQRAYQESTLHHPVRQSGNPYTNPQGGSVQQQQQQQQPGGAPGVPGAPGTGGR